MELPQGGQEGTNEMQKCCNNSSVGEERASRRGDIPAEVEAGGGAGAAAGGAGGAAAGARAGAAGRAPAAAPVHGAQGGTR